MTELTRDKQKAILEAMLFVSTVPVAVSKMVKRLKKAESKINQEQSTEEVAVESEQENLEVSAVEENQEASVEAVDAVEDVDSEEEAQALDVSAEDNESDETTEEDDDSDDDVMSQLMQKQAELDKEISAVEVRELLTEIQSKYAEEEHGVELVAVAKGYQFRTKYDVSEFLKDDKVQAPSRFSPSSLETLAIVAYQQPVTKQRIEDIRGVDSGGVLKTLLDKNIIRIVGRSEDAGRALMYGTSNRFLEIFSLKNLRDLPSLKDLQNLGEGESEVNFYESKKDVSDVTVSDLLDTDLSEMDEASQKVLDDLDDSLKTLKQVEKEVLASQETQSPEDAPAVEDLN